MSQDPFLTEVAMKTPEDIERANRLFPSFTRGAHDGREVAPGVWDISMDRVLHGGMHRRDKDGGCEPTIEARHTAHGVVVVDHDDPDGTSLYMSMDKRIYQRAFTRVLSERAISREATAFAEYVARRYGLEPEEWITDMVWDLTGRGGSRMAEWLHYLIARFATSPPNDLTLEKWEERSRRELRRQYKSEAERDRRMAKVNEFVKNRPEMLKVLAETGLGSHPDVVRTLAMYADTLRIVPQERKGA